MPVRSPVVLALSLIFGIVTACTSQQAAPAGDMALLSNEPLVADSATLYVNGLSCPLCASSIDKQLARLPGVQKVCVDLSSGKDSLSLGGEARPSPSDLATAVADSGFTLVRIVPN